MAMSNETYHWGSEFALQHQARGEALGEARGEALGEAAAGRRAVLQVLALRNIDAGSAVREQLENCTMPSVLEDLLARALDVETAEQLFR